MKSEVMKLFEEEDNKEQVWGDLSFVYVHLNLRCTDSVGCIVTCFRKEVYILENLCL